MRLVLVVALVALPAGCALAAGAAAPAASGPPVCTTTTMVVKRGDVVLSTSSSTRCEKVPSAGEGLHPGAMLKAPDAVLGTLSLVGGGEALSPRNAPADWRVIDQRSGAVCHLVLNARPGPSGLPARSEGCRGALARASTWSFQDGSVEVLAGDGAPIVRLSGDRRRLSGQAADGDRLELQR